MKTYTHKRTGGILPAIGQNDERRGEASGRIDLRF